MANTSTTGFGLGPIKKVGQNDNNAALSEWSIAASSALISHNDLCKITGDGVILVSGDGEVNVKSRIQMKLFEAKKAAEREFEEVLERLNLTRKAFVRAFSFPELQKPFIKLSGKFIGTAARALYANSDKVYVATKETEAEGAV